MKKNILKTLIATALTITTLGSLTACGTKVNAASDAGTAAQSGITADVIRVATQPGVYAANILLAKKNGYFTEELDKLGYKDLKITWDLSGMCPFLLPKHPDRKL